MDLVETVLIGTLALVLALLAVFFGWRQVRILAATRLDDEEAAFRRSQAWRRLFCSALMLILAGMLAGSFMLDRELRRRLNEGNAQQAVDAWFLQRFTGYWTFLLLVVFLLLFMALIDARATLRFGLRKQRELREEHRRALQRDLQEIRERQNNSPGSSP